MDFLSIYASGNMSWKTLALCLTTAGTLFQFWVDAKQLGHLRHPAPPATMLPILRTLPYDRYKPETQCSRVFARSQQYARAKLHFGFVSGAIGFIEGLVTLANIDKIWHFSVSLLSNPAPIPCAISYTVVSSLLGMITSLPLSYYKTFVLEEAYGFNKTTRKTWVMDQFKSVALMATLALPLTGALVWIVEWAGPQFVRYLMAFVLALQLILVPVYPWLIAPIFNKFTPLSDYPESEKMQELINNLAAKLNFPLGKVYVIDGSKRSAHSNAYFTGLPFLSKQIVLYDTLLKDQTPEEVEAVLAHELGHWSNSDTLRMLVMGQLNLFFLFNLFSLFLFNPAIFRSFGITPSPAYGSRGGVPIIVGFSLASALLTPCETLISFATNAFSRKLEFAADRFAAEQGYKEKLQEGLVSMMGKNAAIYDVSPLYSALHNSHPTLLERLNALNVFHDKKQ